MNAMPDLPLTLHPSRARTALWLLLSLVVVAIGVLMVRDAKLAGYFVGGVFTLGVLVFAINLLPQAAYLRLTEEGFIFCSLFRAQCVLWDTVAEFNVIVLPTATVSKPRLVAWNFVPGYPSKGSARKISQALSGYEAALPDTYGLKHDELAGLMNALLRRYGGRGSFHLDVP